MIISRRRFFKMTVATVVVVSTAPKLLAAPQESVQEKILPLLGSSFYLSLHSGEPDFMLSKQTDKEAYYRGYERVDMRRDKFNWAMETEALHHGEIRRTIYNAKAAIFKEVKEDVRIPVTHFGLGTARIGDGSLIMYGLLAYPLVLVKGVTPLFEARAIALEIW